MAWNFSKKTLKILKAVLGNYKPVIGDVKHDRWSYRFEPIEYMYQKQVDDLPEAIDWKKKGLLDKVSLQGDGQLDIKELTECDPQKHLYPDGGGSIANSLFYIYNGLGLEACRHFKGPRAYIDSYEWLWDEVFYVQALSHQTIAASIGANPMCFQCYNGTHIYKGVRNYGKINHAVALTGYGEDKNGKLFYHLMNSHGEEWGDKGFMCIEEYANGIGVDGAYYPVILSSTLNLENLEDPETLRFLFGFNLVYRYRRNHSPHSPRSTKFGLLSRYSLQCLITGNECDIYKQMKMALNQSKEKKHSTRETSILDTDPDCVMNIDTLPTYLTVRIIRDYENKLEMNQKLFWKADVPEKLDVEELCTQRCKLKEYNLVAALSCEGHNNRNYFAYVKESTRKWVKFDFDREIPLNEIKVETIQPGEVPKEISSAYILMYKAS